MNLNVEKQIHKKLMKLAPGFLKLQPGDYRHSEITSCMDLQLEERNHSIMIVKLTHSYKDSVTSNLVMDSNIKIKICLKKHLAEALSYKDAFGFEYSSEHPRLRTKLNQLLDEWLSHCKSHGHRLR